MKTIFKNFIIFIKFLEDVVTNNPLLCFVLFVTMFSIVTFSPLGTLYWIYAFTLYFFIKKEYKNIIIICGFYFFFWHFAFTALFLNFDSPILIGGNHTSEILNHITQTILDYPFLTNLCLETTFLLHCLSQLFGFNIYIPSYLYGFWKIIKFFIDLIDSDDGDEESSRGDSKPSSGSSSSGYSSYYSNTIYCSPSKKNPFPKEAKPSYTYPSPGVSPTDIKFEDFKYKTSDFKSSNISDNVPEVDTRSCEELLQNVNASRCRLKFFDSLVTKSNKNGDEGKIALSCDVPFVGKAKGCIEVSGEFFKHFKSTKDKKKNK